MKRQGRFAPVFAILLMATISAFAKDSRDVKVTYAASVGGTTVTPGQYKLRWDSNNADPEVAFLKGRKVVAKTHGQWVDRSVEYDRNSVVYDTGSDGSRSILEMRFAGSSKVLVFGAASSAAQGHSGSAPATESAPAAPAGKPGKGGDKTSSIRFLGKPTAARQHQAGPSSPVPIMGFQPNFKLPVFPATPEQLVRRPYGW
ncbi:MAG TPA: hypothetical protein VG204_17240 [Terriglobia bacterium]|nr:hypothetical protein [Terriglobia bacterium]